MNNSIIGLGLLGLAFLGLVFAVDGMANHSAWDDIGESYYRSGYRSDWGLTVAFLGIAQMIVCGSAAFTIGYYVRRERDEN